MEAELIRHLELLLARYRERVDHQESTVGRHCAADGEFFPRLRKGATITARKYDAVVAWFSANWPEGAVWPEDVMRPAAAVAAE